MPKQFQRKIQSVKNIRTNPYIFAISYLRFFLSACIPVVMYVRCKIPLGLCSRDNVQCSMLPSIVHWTVNRWLQYFLPNMQRVHPLAALNLFWSTIKISKTSSVNQASLPLAYILISLTNAGIRFFWIKICSEKIEILSFLSCRIFTHS